MKASYLIVTILIVTNCNTLFVPKDLVVSTASYERLEAKNSSLEVTTLMKKGLKPTIAIFSSPEAQNRSNNFTIQNLLITKIKQLLDQNNYINVIIYEMPEKYEGKNKKFFDLPGIDAILKLDVTIGGFSKSIDAIDTTKCIASGKINFEHSFLNWPDLKMLNNVQISTDFETYNNCNLLDNNISKIFDEPADKILENYMPGWLEYIEPKIYITAKFSDAHGRTLVKANLGNNFVSISRGKLFNVYNQKLTTENNRLVFKKEKIAQVITSNLINSQEAVFIITNQIKPIFIGHYIGS